MGAYWLDGRVGGYPSLDAVIRGAGIPIKLYNGWQSRSRSSGGFNSVWGVICHHTASPSTQSFQPCWDYCAVGHPDAPVANMLLGRDGTVGLHAAGASNHAGKGGPWKASKGTIPLDSANSYMIGIEAQNDGVGETWAPAMMESYEKLCAAICVAYGLAATDCVAHDEWAPTRKIDPWGGNTPTPGFVYTGPREWPMRGGQGFCDYVAKRMTDSGDDDEVTNPILMLIQPQVDGTPNPAWFVRFASGHLVWASNAETAMCSTLGVPATPIVMGADQYNRLLAEATAGQANASQATASAMKGNVAPDPD